MNFRQFKNAISTQIKPQIRLKEKLIVIYVNKSPFS